MSGEALAVLAFCGACVYTIGMAWLGDIRTRRASQLQRDREADQRFVEGRRYQ
jgi:hypothetical protein